jgi:enamine deaminase RidA (YjgF/YER057c/UK114 family)
VGEIDMRIPFALCALAMLAGCAAIDFWGSETPPRQSIVPAPAQGLYDQLHFSPAMRAGDYVFLSGVVAGVPEGETSAAAMEASFDRAFRNVGDVLRAAGADWNDVVEMTTYHTDLPAQFDTFSRVKDRHVGEPYPAWTAIDVDRLLPDTGIVEIRVVAYAPRD